MKNNSNIYDIDGELIRAFDDTHKWSVKEAQEKIEYYRKKIEEVGEDSDKVAVYATYIRNLTKYVWELYAKMTPEQFNAELENAKKQENLQEQIQNAMEELKREVEEDGTGVDNTMEQSLGEPTSKTEVNDGTTETSTNDEVPGTITGDNESSANRESGDVETIERERSDVHEEGPTTQSDLLVERTDVNNSMDEYVTFEEVK